jgi:hypothetical protein
MLKRLSPAMVAIVFTAGLFAQNRTGISGGHATVGAGHGFAPAAHRGSIAISGFGEGFHRRGFRHSGFFNGPYLYPGFYPEYYSDFDDSYQYQPPPRPSAPEPAAASQVQQQPLPAPALLELQGSQWVKVTSFTMGQSPLSTRAAQPSSVVKEMPPTILVYRDGRTEELSSYSIIGDSIYTKSDYWTSGTWTRTIQIADLDISSTLKQNQRRGVKFELPSGPNEVMIRP